MQCLLPKTPTLEQAGGLHRMVLRGHTGAILKTLLTPGGIDVITGDCQMPSFVAVGTTPLFMPCMPQFWCSCEHS